MDDVLRNRTFEEIRLGDSASMVRMVGRDDIELFAAVSGDMNPSHLDDAFAAAGRFGVVVAHGMWTAALVSAVLGTRLPGPGTIYLGQEIRFLKPVAPGDTVTATVTVTAKRPDKQIVTLATACTNQAGEEVLSGTATVIAPEQAIAWPRPRLPHITLQRHVDRLATFVKQARSLGPVRAAIVHPCSADAVASALMARDEGLIEPVMVGPEHAIRAAAEDAGLSLQGVEIVPAEHGGAATARGVELAVSGRAAILVNGSVDTGEFLGTVTAPGSGLRTARRISHAYAMDVPACDKPLIVTDAAINVRPSLGHKRDICQNAIDLLHALGQPEPRVAVLAAGGSAAKTPAALDAAALSAMAASGQITGATVEGPLSFDDAVVSGGARIAGTTASVAEQADILLVPELETGNMLVAQLMRFAGATAAGLALGARVPIVLTSQSDPLHARIASAALARLVAADRPRP